MSHGVPHNSETISPREPQPALEARDIGHSYGDHEVLGKIDFIALRGEFVCIVGPSGVGKTTLLRCLASLQTPTRGQLLVLDQIAHEPQPGVALVFQDYSRSLLPWSSVLDNVTLPLVAHGMPREEASGRALTALRQVGLVDDKIAKKYPWQLSGGMQQRVAIARALAYDPEVLLMDEPFASVDAQTRTDLEDLLRKVQEDLGLTVVLVTHDIDEAVYLSDKIVALSGSPATVAEIVEVPLGRNRDQIETKARPEFGEIRARIYKLIREAQAKKPA